MARTIEDDAHILSGEYYQIYDYDNLIWSDYEIKNVSLEVFYFKDLYYPSIAHTVKEGNVFRPAPVHEIEDAKALCQRMGNAIIKGSVVMHRETVGNYVCSIIDNGLEYGYLIKNIKRTYSSNYGYSTIFEAALAMHLKLETLNVKT